MPDVGVTDIEAWRARAHAYAEEFVRPAAEAIDRDDALPDSIVHGLRGPGFFGLGVPASWGGSGGDTRTVAAVLEELSAASAAVGVLLSVHLSVCTHPILLHGTDAQRERLVRPLASGRALGAFALTEPGVGSDAAHISTRYSRTPSGFLLNGSKMFITNGARADVVLAFATRDAAAGAHGVSAFVVEKGTRGVGTAQKLEKLGLRGSETNELVFQDALVPEENLLGPEGEGLKLALSALTAGRVGIAACALGVARSAFDALQAAAVAEPTDGRRSAVAGAFTTLSAARALVEKAAAEKDAGRPYVEAASVAKLFASRAAVEIASTAVDVAGPAGVRRGAAPERLLRDARVFPIVEGTTEIQQLILGRTLVGR
ncbi:MAG: acyl-CoA dehydrogenase family protein [Thermoplasmata archaeon]|nr:acyl-CoA dehydrogenase family protein [Thermoplasmata archaeon]MCI4362162.1 acyl-CoA dehydrogenase family protein [Thermoplasmata archaeon]